MKKTALAIGLVAALGVAAAAPAEARGGFGPGLVGGLAAGALLAGATGAYGYGYGPYRGYYGQPYAYGPGYYPYRRAYYRPRYYGYGPGYAYGPRYRYW